MTATKRASASNKKQSKKADGKQSQQQASGTDALEVGNPGLPASSMPLPTVSASAPAPAPAVAGSDESPRLPNTTVCVPIAYGSIAFFLGKKADEYHTHRWTLYVRGPNDEDLSVAVAKVVFQLHPSFPQPVRELTAPPFEVTEKGWGEFEATIRIVWRDPDEKATVLTHGIKLYPPGLTAVTPSTTSKEPVVHEFYEEVVFADPRESFHRQLMRMSVLPHVQSHEPTVQESFPRYSDEDDWKALLEAQKFLERELKMVKGRMLQADSELEELDAALMQAAQAKAQASAAAAASGGKSKSGSSKKSRTS